MEDKVTWKVVDERKTLAIYILTKKKIKFYINGFILKNKFQWL